MPQLIEYILIAMCLSIVYLAWAHHYRDVEWERRFRLCSEAAFTTDRNAREQFTTYSMQLIALEERLRSLEGLRDSTILKRPLTQLVRRA